MCPHSHSPSTNSACADTAFVQKQKDTQKDEENRMSNVNKSNNYNNNKYINSSNNVSEVPQITPVRTEIIRPPQHPFFTFRFFTLPRLFTFIGSTQEPLSTDTNKQIHTNHHRLTDDNDESSDSDTPSSTEDTLIFPIALDDPAVVSAEANTASGGRDALVSFLSALDRTPLSLTFSVPAALGCTVPPAVFAELLGLPALTACFPLSALGPFQSINTTNSYSIDNNNRNNRKRNGEGRENNNAAVVVDSHGINGRLSGNGTSAAALETTLAEYLNEKYLQIDIFDDLSSENAGNSSADVDERMNYSYNSQEDTQRKAKKLFQRCYFH